MSPDGSLPMSKTAIAANPVERMIAAWDTSFAKAEVFDAPYRHFYLRNLFPKDIIEALNAIDASAPDLNGVSGKRELHNDDRFYFNRDVIDANPVAHAISTALQSQQAVSLIEKLFSVDLTGSLLRLEYAQDIDGFWLHPHTDLGVKKISMLIYLNDAPTDEQWGTDIFNTDHTHHKCMDHGANLSLIHISEPTRPY